ncbi:hypothetical protein L1049_017327 [Liquidambar formosana]|uniref:RNase H type-1 domain-containing protein n=1 Tax=Liquidambar formosana TaxID=63359 RepID=A0AAP0S0Q2_LIQFO
MDGSSLGNPEKTNARGLIRNHIGQWIKNYARKLRIMSSLEAEMWGLCDGLDTALKCSISNLIVEVDASVVFSLLPSG